MKECKRHDWRVGSFIGDIKRTKKTDKIYLYKKGINVWCYKCGKKIKAYYKGKFRIRHGGKKMRYCYFCKKPMYTSNCSIWIKNKNFDVHKVCKDKYSIKEKSK